VAPKGEQEVLYFGPGQRCAGLDYSVPYNCLDPNSLADGTINTSQINGFVTSAPWLANAPFQTSIFTNNEFTMGIFSIHVGQYKQGVQFLPPLSYFIIVTNIAVYISVGANPASFPTSVTPGNLSLLHTWAVSEIQLNLTDPGNCISFVEVNGVVYFTGLMLNGIFSINLPAGNVFAQATNYVCGAYIAELAGRLIVAQCRFPGGGGTGTGVLPTVAWSGVGLYAGSGATDPWNPANINNLGTIGGFNLLADVPDQITGLAGMGRSAIIFREQGLTQCDPNPGSANSGIQPFNFYHLWASAQGVGAVKGTVAQFGYTVYFLSSDNVYSMNLYSGPQPIGPRIIAKIIADKKAVAYNAGLVGSGTVGSGSGSSFWYYASIVNVSGQLHYLLTFSSYKESSTGTQQYNAAIYDCNLSENAWHFDNLNSYVTVSGTVGTALAFSCPIFQASELQGYFSIFLGSTVIANFAPEFILCGYISNFGSLAAFSQTGTVGQLVFWDYNFNSNLYSSSMCGPLYPPLAMPPTTIVFRGEVIAIGKRNTERRLLIQADNAPLPFTPTLPVQQQQATVTMQGSFAESVKTSALNWTQGGGKTQPYMQGNYAPLGLPIQTYYADMVLSDEMIQASITSNIVDSANPWNSMCAFRLTTAMLVLDSTKGTIQ
jgi:hypothetical protein